MNERGRIRVSAIAHQFISPDDPVSGQEKERDFDILGRLAGANFLHI